MPELTHVFDANHDNFQTLAVENSHKGLVLVNFWTPGVGPCLKLWEALEALVEEYQGRFLLVNVNTESQRQLVRDNGITSVPTVKLYQRGKVVDSIHGAQSANALRQVLNQYIPSLQAQEKVAAIRAYQQGEVDSALKILAEACMKNPDNRELHATAMKLLLREQRLDDLMQYHAVLPDKVRQHNEILALVSHGRILQMAQEAPARETLDAHLQQHPDDLEAAMQRGAQALVDNDTGLALEYFFYVFQQNRQFQDGFSQQALLAVFSLLGHGHELTREFQQRMRDVLH